MDVKIADFVQIAETGKNIKNAEISVTADITEVCDKNVESSEVVPIAEIGDIVSVSEFVDIVEIAETAEMTRLPK